MVPAIDEMPDTAVDPITIRFQLTFDEYRNAQRAISNAIRKSLDWDEVNSIVISILIIMIAFCEFTDGHLQYVTLVAAMYVFVIKPIWYRIGRKRYFKQISAYEYEYQFTPEKIIVRRVGSVTEHDWDTIKKCVSAPKGIILVWPLLYIWIPDFALENSERLRLETLLKSKVSQYKTSM